MSRFSAMFDTYVICGTIGFNCLHNILHLRDSMSHHYSYCLVNYSGCVLRADCCKLKWFIMSTDVCCIPPEDCWVMKQNQFNSIIPLIDLCVIKIN